MDPRPFPAYSLRVLGTFLAWLLLAGAPLPAQTLEELAADPARWPREVTLTASARATVLKDGAPAGAMLLGAGRILLVTAVSPEGVTGRIGTEHVRVPADRTDLFQRLGAPAPAPAARPGPAARTSTAGRELPITAGAPGRPSRMQRQLAGRLVRLEGGALKAVDDAALNGVKYFALYYSASWCGPCRQFTPEFVGEYRRLKAAHPEFEAVFLSGDRSAGEMRAYMKDDAMPWLAVKFDERTHELMSYAGPGIPCLVLVAADGRVLSDSYQGDNYVGPGKVLADTALILATKR
ncbi:MAG TPA: thioredoxin-like domain-containing protein [Opitutaceae bacterium]|nr:thioredoxin-like domain-containing protein [Opitutaceae bacterium]